MAHQVLEALKTDEFALRFSYISSPRAIHRALQRSKDVEMLQLALQTGEITEETLRGFSAALLRDLEYGRRFPHELAIAAIAVALEARPTPFAEEFVMDLARLELPELPIAIRVAREACRELLRLPSNKTKAFSIAREEAPIAEWQRAPDARRVMVSQSEVSFELEAS